MRKTLFVGLAGAFLLASGAAMAGGAGGCGWGVHTAQGNGEQQTVSTELATPTKPAQTAQDASKGTKG